MRENLFDLIVGLDHDNSAKGSLYWDNGVEKHENVANDYLRCSFEADMEHIGVDCSDGGDYTSNKAETQLGKIFESLFGRYRSYLES
jgi:hypothetical protein